MKDLLKRLHPLERKIIPFLKNNITLTELAKKSGMQEVEATRAIQWLSNKELVTVNIQETESIVLAKNGEHYLKNKLPERRMLEQLKDKALSMQDIKLEKGELNIAIGELKKRKAITMGKEISLTAEGKKLLKKEFSEETFLSSLPKDLEDLNEEEQVTYKNLQRRKDMLLTEKTKIKTIKITEECKELQKEDLNIDYIETLTQDMLKEKSWKGKDFRTYDVQVQVPQTYGGKRQPYMEFLTKIKNKLVQLGFKEMTGPLIETEFFNFDVLYQPQNHPARTWTDTYHLKRPVFGKLPDELVVNRVKNTHEDGGQTQSTGWGYKWDPMIAAQLMPRAHGTALSARTMAKNPKTPCKYFAIARVYRPDVLDATHLIEFNQMEGFVADDTINFKTLLGILKQFAIEVAGAEDVRFFPDYYPFTEPSVQMSAKHPELGWVELGGAGIFRPEVTEPLGIDLPVMAWGLGIDRLAMFKLGIKDIRYLFAQDLKWLRKPRMI